MKEFELIRQIQQQASNSGSNVLLGIGDDAAILEVPAGRHLVAATDTLNAGTHFPLQTSPFDIGHKCLAVNLSDLAAMGATPHWALLSLSLPEIDPAWVKAFTDGLMTLANRYGVALVGGDTTSGPMSISVTALGSVATGTKMLRSAAVSGDLVVVSGTVGGAALALAQLQAGEAVDEQLLLDRPEPRVALGQVLAPYAHACIDISDGLLADLGHILRASSCAAQLEVDRLPASAALAAMAPELRHRHQLSGGDDYELLFTIPKDMRKQLSSWSREAGVALTVIGEITEGSGIECVASDGSAVSMAYAGFEHFGFKP